MFVNYNIYMLPTGHPKAFLGSMILKDKCIADKSEYEYVYCGTISVADPDDYIEPNKFINGVLEQIFEQLNINHPKDYKCHSLSVSDVVEIKGKYFFCDSFGWNELDW